MSTSLQAHSMILKTVRQTNPREDIRRQRVFAWGVAALLITTSPLLSQWSMVVTGRVKAKSKLRRLYRWLSNGYVDVAAYYRPFIKAALAGWEGRDIRLAIDGTSPNGACVVVRLSLCFRGRALPMCWKTFATRSHSVRYDWYVAVLDQALALIPEGCSVTLLGDRGFGHRRLMKWCKKAGWHYVLRLKADSIVVLRDGSRCRLDTWKPERQTVMHLADVRVQDEHRQLVGPLHIHMAFAPEPAKEPWYLASDQAGSYAATADYRCRMQIEASFRDDKSGGWNWEDSPLTRPDQVERLCLAMAVATLFAVPEGTLLADAGRRQEIDPHDSRGLSYFQIGVRSVQQLLSLGRRLKLRLKISPKVDPDPVSAYGIPFPLYGGFRWVPASRPAGC
mgnify:CR=1 FL=1